MGLIFNPVKIGTLLVLYCYSHNRAHQASGFAAGGAFFFSLQKHVISQDLHFLRGNHFHESVFEAKSCYRSEVCSFTIAAPFQLHQQDSAILYNCFCLFFSHVFPGMFYLGFRD